MILESAFLLVLILCMVTCVHCTYRAEGMSLVGLKNWQNESGMDDNILVETRVYCNNSWLKLFMYM